MSGPHCPLRYKLLVRTVGKMQQRVDVLQLPHFVGRSSETSEFTN